MSAQFRAKFNDKLNELMSKKDSPTFLLTKEKYQWIIDRLHVLNTTVMKKKSTDYRLLNRYEAIVVPGTTEKKLQKVNTEFLYVCNEDLFDIIHDIHTTTGHGARDLMNALVKKKYANVTKQVLQLFTDLCDECHVKKKKTKIPKKKLLPALATMAIPRCQVDVVEVQMNGSAHFIMSYQDLQTKYTYLKVIESTDGRDVAAHLVQTFAVYGAPCILESYNGREFAKKVVSEVRKVWPKCVLVYGKQSTTRILDPNILDILNRWMVDNNTSNWMDGLPFVQWEKNNKVHPETKMTPYFAMFSSTPTLGLHSFDLPNGVIVGLEREEDLEDFIRPTKKVGEDAEQQSAAFLVHQLHNIPVDDSTPAVDSTTTETESDVQIQMKLVSRELSHEMSCDSPCSEDDEVSGHNSDGQETTFPDILQTRYQMSAGSRDYLPPSSLLHSSPSTSLLSLPGSSHLANMDIIRSAWGLMLNKRPSTGGSMETKEGMDRCSQEMTF